MQDFTIQVAFEDPWYLVRVVGHDEYYAQGRTYEEALSNLFSVIQTLRELDAQKHQASVPRDFSFAVPMPA